MQNIEKRSGNAKWIRRRIGKLKIKKSLIGSKKHYVCFCDRKFECAKLTLDEIEDMELYLTDVIKQLQEYRIKQNHG